jgi:hypothetical protein
LSDEIYSNSTRFLLELIQNADDNSYEASVPSLSFTYDNGGLRIDCNERGFTEANVEAICHIGETTKTGSGYIGEKGVGFKSVFKVADVVWISSGGYSFKFDKNKQFGRIAPIWAKFPKDPISGYTSFYMELSPNYNEEVIQELRSMDLRMLLFLRRLREINVTIVQSECQSEWKSELRRTDKCENNITITSLEQGGTCMQYIVYRQNVDNLPPEPKRSGVSQSEILLAFPIANEDQDLQLSSQHVYNFLPVKDYSFKVSTILTVVFLYTHSTLVHLARRLFAHCQSRRYSRLV